ncbi:TetR/AcrR family transcriptional regulator [Chondromyces crocatus]|uniref:TetR family transcriptional regulator n=1 Tax=Chondromyces crocatus TaxID=52 RepID=A0A0K1EPW6_CHOCO|nr:TetR/AcrR family transcriptional regulator [Chondromyces crocatus]AKT42687.1 TetR family transcriptional regulator [Chondromyces crocatus]
MCPRSAEQVEQLKDERRSALLRAARVVFSRKGFAAAKIADVAAGAGISHGLVYHYFPDKEALFAATVSLAVEGWQSLLSQVLEEPGTPLDRLTSLCGKMIAGLGDEPEYLLLIIQAHTGEGVPESLRALLQQHRRKVFEDLTTLIVEGQRAGLIVREIPDALARALLALIQGMAINRLIDAGETPPPLVVVTRLLKV